VTSACVLVAALRVVQAVDDAADVEAEEAIDLTHPFGVAAGEVVVYRHYVDALAGQGIKVNRCGGDQSLAFAGFHFGDVAVVQHHAADELNVEMALAERALGGLADGGEGLEHEVVELAPLGDLFAELEGLLTELLVRELHELRLERINPGNLGVIRLEDAVVAGAEKSFGQRGQA
jgi:hypothetical protein